MDSLSPSRRPLLAAVSVALLAVAASATSLGNGFALDDVAIVLENPRVQSLDGIGKTFVEAYWPARLGPTLYRPLTLLGFGLEWAVGHGSPWVFHAVNVVLYAAVSVGVLGLAATMLPPGAAWIAAALFAVHPVHTEAVAGVVGQSEISVALVLVLGTWAYIRWRRAGPIGWARGAGLVLLYLAACLLKEHALVFPGLLLVAELTVLRGTAAHRGRLGFLYVALAVAGAVFWMARAKVIGPGAGDLPAIQITHATYGQRLLTMLGVVPEWVRLLVWPAHLQADYNPREIVTATRFGLAQSVGLALVLLGGAAGFVALRRNAAAAFGLGWLAVTLFPVSNLAIKTGVVLAERTLFLPSVGAMIAVGCAVPWLLREGRPALPPGRAAPDVRLVGALVLLVLGLGIWRSAIRNPVWKDSMTLFAQTVRDAPLSYRAHAMYGSGLFYHGRAGEGEREFRRAIELYPDDGIMLAEFADHYQKAGLCYPAIPLYERAATLITGWRHVEDQLARCRAAVATAPEAATP